jgi:uncharacterized protein
MAFVLRIRDIPEGNSRQRYQLPGDQFHLDYEAIENAGDLTVWGDASRFKDQLIFRGQLSLPVRLVCARCAGQFERTIESELIFVLKFVPDQAEEVLEEGESEDFYFLPEGTLEFDCTDLIRDRVILSVGLKPLCREDCKGICPLCGTNLNIKECSCEKEDIDDRWLPLKDLTDRS